jgi:dimethylargininase
MQYKKAIVRKPGRNFASGITTSGLGKPVYQEVLKQHEAYRDTLKKCGLELIVLEADERYPDGCFVEDTAVVINDAAIIARPGAFSRQGEEDEISEVLSKYRKIVKIKAPGTLDGGDILRAGSHLYIGISGRTNNEGARQLAAILEEYGYTSSEVTVGKGLHLKSGIGYAGNGIYISAPEFASVPVSSEVITTEPGEGYIANCLQVNEYLLIAAGFPGTIKKITSTGIRFIELNMSEFRKMDGGLTCLSILF